MAAYEVLLLNTAIPQIQAAQAGDTYVVPRDIAFSTVASFAAGTEALPSLVATGDVNTGFWFPAADTIAASTGGTRRLTLDASGNLGLGVTPSAWGSGINVFDVGAYSSLWDSGGFTGLSSNGYFNSGWKYKNSAAASKYEQTAGAHAWFNAPSGTANTTTITNGVSYTIITSGNQTDFGAANNNVGTSFTATSGGTLTSGTVTQNISFTQAMTLDASGNLGVGATTVSPTGLAILSGGQGKGVLVARNATGSPTSGQSLGSYAFKSIMDGVNSNSQAEAMIEAVAAENQSGSTAATNLLFYTKPSGVGPGSSPTERARITSGGNLNFGNSSADRATTAGTAVINIFNGTAPVGTLANGISLYSSSGEAYVMDAAGNATLFSPHDSETNEWIFKSKHTPSGKVLKIDVEKMLRFINDHFGLDAIHEFTEE